jgi:PAS domain S-box-containing protein
VKSAPEIANPTSFLASGGEMGRRIREFDWLGHSLGPPEGWPQSLKVAVRIMLTSRYAMWMGWGPEFYFFCNDAYAPTLGIKRESALGLSARKVWAEIWSDVGPRAESVVRSGEATWDESLLLFLERSGYPEETYHTFSYSPVPDDDGSVGGMLCVVTEETERVIGARRLALLRDLGADLAAIKEEAELFRAITARMAERAQDLPFALIYLLATDGESVQLACSHGAATGSPMVPQIIGLKDEKPVWPAAAVFAGGQAVPVDAIAARFTGLPADPWDKPPRSALLVPIAEQGQERPAGFLVAGLNPYRPLDAPYRGFLDLLAGQIAAGLASARAYEAERKRAEALAEIDRVKTAFFSNVSHEFRTPLTLLLGPLEELVTKADENSEDQRRLAAVAHRNALRLLKLVNSLLDFSRLEAGRARAHFEPTDLAACTAELASSFRSAMEKAGLDFIVECPRLPEPVYVDREMWERIVLNLLSNAFKFTLHGEVRVTVQALNGVAELIVRDTGTGIPDEAQTHLFERFYRVQGAPGRTHEGSGIGLALVHELVKLHGGMVRLESEPGRGSAFIVTLRFGSAHLPEEQCAAAPDLGANASVAPAFVAEALRWLPDSPPPRDAVPDEADAADAMPTSNGPRPRILLAEDNADMREYIARLLSSRFEVTAVANGQAALEAALNQQPDLLLTDVMMPQLDGLGLLRQMRARAALKSVPIILLSARAGEEARVEGLDAGADDYLIKPFHARELLAKITGTLRLAKARAEALARETELRAERSEILESMNLAFMAMDKNFRIIYLNAEAGRLHGMTAEKYLGRIHWEAFPATVGTLIETNYRRTMAERVPLQFENFYEPWQQWFELNAYPMAGGGLGVFFREITEYKQAVERLRASEERFRQIANTMPQMVWVTHPDGRHEYFNSRWYEFTGVPDGSTGGEGWAGLFHPADDARVRAQWRQNLNSGELYEIEYRLRRHDGRYCWFLCRALPVRDQDGRIIRWFGTCTDIDDFKRIEAALRETHDRLQTVLSSITDGLAVLDKDWRYSYVSEQAARIIGMRSEQLLGGRVWDLFPRAEGTKFHEGYHRAVETGQSVEFEEFYPEPINKWLECRCYPSAEGLSIYFHDITARKQAEAVLRQNEALFSILIEQAPLGVYVVDAQFRLQQVNSIAMPAFAHVHPLIGRDFSEVMEILWGPEIGGQCARIFRHTLETGERYISPPFSAPRQDLGVEKAFDWETQRVTLPDGRHGVVCYFTDVTERRRAEVALQEAKDAAEAANSSKDRFLAVLSHELRTPLTPVLMAAAALEHDPNLRPDVREDLAMIKRNIELETKLIDDLLDLNRITSGKLPLYLEPLDLNAAVRDVCGICRPALQERGIALKMTFDDDAGSVSADSARLRQVLWNVLKNAIKFTSEQGTIRVTTQRLASGFCQVRVRDSGIGIPPKVLPRIFNAFEQGDASVTRQFGGLGLGLAICKALVDLHGGTIRAESAGSGQGSTFIVELPGAAPAALAKLSNAISPEHQSTRPLRLLLVEDHADTARALSLLLSRAGYAVITASDVEGAAAAAEREPFDLLISDLGLPDGNGHDVIRRVRAHRIVPAIAMSGYGMDEDVRRSREAGFTEHLVKPIDVPQLITAIRRATAEREA